jgi:hypothetical protein
MALEDLRPRLALRVGVTGHRTLIPEVADSVRLRTRSVLEGVKMAAETAAMNSGGNFSEAQILLCVVSPLAEGADRIVAAEALQSGYELQCPLPFPREEYCRDFSGDASIQEFTELLDRAVAVFELDGSRVPSGAPYEAVARLVLDQCDLLIAIWDGQPARGKGGTANVIGMATERQIPVICLHTERGDDRLISPGDDMDGAAVTPELLDKVVRQQLLPPWLSHTPEDPDVSGSYVVSEQGGTSLLGRVWRAFEKVMTIGVNYPAVRWPDAPRPAFADPFEQEYNRVNEPANRLAGLYRGAFLVNYTLGVCAVFLALLSYADGPRSSQWLIGELVSITTVFALAGFLRRRRWHRRTVDCRYLAEQFRILRYIHPLGLSAPQPHLPAHFQHGDTRDSWMNWRLRARMRHTRMPSVKVTQDFLRQCHRLIRDDWVFGQINYHARNATRLHLIDERLHRLVWLFTAVAALACVAHLVIHDHHVAPWLTLLAAGFPAAAGACHAISTQGEFRKLAERSGAMSENLTRLEVELRAMDAGGGCTAASLRRSAEKVAQVMIEEVLDWQILYRKQPFNPA